MSNEKMNVENLNEGKFKVLEEIPTINRNSMAKGALILTILSNFTTIADFLIVIYASTILTLENVGLYNLLYQYVPIFTLLIGFGMTNTATKLITKHDSQNKSNMSSGIVYKITLINCILAIFFSVVFLIFSESFSNFLTDSPDYSFYVSLIGIQLIFIPNTIFNQFFIVKFKFKVYMVVNLVGNLIRMILFIVILNKTRNISAYFYSSLFGQGFKFFFLLGAIFLNFKKPDYSYPLSSILKYSFPLFLGRIILYFKQWAYILILHFILKYQLGEGIALAQIGLLAYIRMVFNIVNVSFNSMNNVLTIYYSTILNKPNSMKEYEDLTFKMSRFYQTFAFIIGFGFMTISPLYVKIITTIFHYEELYSTGTITMILFGIYFLLSSFYYIAPTVINIHKSSNILLKIHFKSIFIYLLGYVVFIWFFGMKGIPIAQSMGFICFLWLCKRDISKKYVIGFDKKTLKKIIYSLLPTLLIIPILFLFTKYDSKISTINILSLSISIPLYSIVFNSIGIIVGFVLFFLFIRYLKIFNETDKKFFLQLFGKKMGKKMFKFLVKDIKKKR